MKLSHILLLQLELAILSSSYVAKGVCSDLRDIDEEWEVVKGGLNHSKRSMCSFLLVQVSDKELSLSLEKVTGLFEQALDHMARATELTQRIQSYMNEEVLSHYDTNGGLTVLEISEDRKSLVDEYREAVAKGTSQEEKEGILEKYFYKACAQKLGTVLAEKAMYDSVLRVEDFERKKEVKKANRMKTLARRETLRQQQ